MHFFDKFPTNIDTSALFIATVGALFSIAAALYLTSRKIVAEMRYRRIDLTNLYSENMLKRRLDAYLEIWSYVCEYEKIIMACQAHDGSRLSATIENLLKYNSNISDWDNKYGLFISSRSAIACSLLRGVLREILYINHDRHHDSNLSVDDAKNVLNASDRLELALRTDVGIYEIDKSENRELFKDYDDANLKTLGRRYRREG